MVPEEKIKQSGSLEFNMCSLFRIYDYHIRYYEPLAIKINAKPSQSLCTKYRKYSKTLIEKLIAILAKQQ